MNKSFLVSVIIPTWNSGKTLALCLQSVIKQTYKPIEVVVVDGGSFDDTVSIAREYGAKIIKLNRRGRSFQRNMGARYADGNLILNVDSDEVLHPNLIEECVNKVLNEKTDALFIATIDTGLTYIGRSRCVGSIINSRLRKQEAYIPNSSLRFYTKKVFEIVRGYDEDLLIGEDVIFAAKCLRRGFKIGRCKLPVLHFGTEGLKNIFVKKYVYGKTYKRYKEKYRELYSVSSNTKYIQVGLFYVRHLFKFKELAKYIPGFLVVKLVEMLGLFLGSGLGFLF